MLDTQAPANSPPEPQNKAKRSRAATWVRRVLIVGIVSVLFAAWYVLQPLMPVLLPLGTGFPWIGSDRIGRAAVAPLVRKCISNVILGEDSKSTADPSALYFAMKIGSLYAGVHSVLGTRDAVLMVRTKIGWGQLSDCIYAQDAQTLCDRDNRAAAVESLTKFLLYANQSVQMTEPAASASEARIIEAIKSRLLSTFRTRRRDGVFTATDFGFFPPFEIIRIMWEEKASRNICGG